jgi:hypothetical protein
MFSEETGSGSLSPERRAQRITGPDQPPPRKPDEETIEAFQEYDDSGREEYRLRRHLKSLESERKRLLAERNSAQREMRLQGSEILRLTQRIAELEQAERTSKAIASIGNAGVAIGAVLVSVASLCVQSATLAWALAGLGTGLLILGVGLLSGLIRWIWPPRQAATPAQSNDRSS